MPWLPPELQARPFDPAEIGLVAAWFPDEAAAVRWGGPNVHWPVDTAQFAAMQADPARTLWTVTLEGGLAGHFQFYDDRRRRTVRIGRVGLAPELRGRGLGSQLARLATGLAFSRDQGVHRVELHVYATNTVARAAYERAGFTLEGILREDVPMLCGERTEFWSTAIMGLLRADWEARSGQPGPGPGAR
jgi:RimJ/RimL family protein N-acetyltransferase